MGKVWPTKFTADWYRYRASEMDGLADRDSEDFAHVSLADVAEVMRDCDDLVPPGHRDRQPIETPWCMGVEGVILWRLRTLAALCRREADTLDKGEA